MIKSAEEYMTFTRGNLEAFAKSGQILAAGIQDMAKHAAAAAQANLGEAVSVMRSTAQVRSMKDALELQASLTRTALDKAMTQGGQAAEASYRLAEQALAPIAHRMTLAVETFGRA